MSLERRGIVPPLRKSSDTRSILRAKDDFLHFHMALWRCMHMRGIEAQAQHTRQAERAHDMQTKRHPDKFYWGIPSPRPHRCDLDEIGSVKGVLSPRVDVWECKVLSRKRKTRSSVARRSGGVEAMVCLIFLVMYGLGGSRSHHGGSAAAAAHSHPRTCSGPFAIAGHEVQRWSGERHLGQEVSARVGFPGGEYESEETGRAVYSCLVPKKGVRVTEGMIVGWEKQIPDDRDHGDRGCGTRAGYNRRPELMQLRGGGDNIHQELASVPALHAPKLADCLFYQPGQRIAPPPQAPPRPPQEHRDLRWHTPQQQQQQTYGGGDYPSKPPLPHFSSQQGPFSAPSTPSLPPPASPGPAFIGSDPHRYGSLCVTVPAGVVPGQYIEVMVPGKGPTLVIVPPNTFPGQLLEVASQQDPKP